MQKIAIYQTTINLISYLALIVLFGITAYLVGFFTAPRLTETTEIFLSGTLTIIITGIFCLIVYGIIFYEYDRVLNNLKAKQPDKKPETIQKDT